MSMKSFRFPKPQAKVGLDSVLDPVERGPTMEDTPVQMTAKANFHEHMAKLEDPLRITWCMDVDAAAANEAKGTKSRCRAMKNMSECLLKCRSLGYWLTRRGRRMRVHEMLKVQGIDPKSIVQPPSVKPKQI